MTVNETAIHQKLSNKLLNPYRSPQGKTHTIPVKGQKINELKLSIKDENRPNL